MNPFKKLDEKAAKEQLDISNKAAKISLIFIYFALFVWSLIELLQNGPNSLFIKITLIFSTGNSIFLFSFIIMKKRIPQPTLFSKIKD